MRRAAAIVVMSLMLAAAPASAENDKANAIAGALAMGAAAGIVCWVGQLSERENARTHTGEEEERKFDRTGVVLGASGRYGFGNYRDNEQEDLAAAFVPFPVTLTAGDSWGVSGWLGYRCHRRIAVEVETEWMQGFEGVISDLSQGPLATYITSPILITANVKGYLLTGRIQPFVLLGGGAMLIESKTTDLLVGAGTKTVNRQSYTMRFGGGVDFYITKWLALTVDADYILPLSGFNNLEYTSVGVGLQFRY